MGIFISSEIRVRIGLKIQNRKLKLDLTKTKQLLTEKDVKILEKLIMKKNSFSVLPVLERLLCVMDDISMFMLGRKD